MTIYESTQMSNISIIRKHEVAVVIQIQYLLGSSVICYIYI